MSSIENINSTQNLPEKNTKVAPANGDTPLAEWILKYYDLDHDGKLNSKEAYMYFCSTLQDHLASSMTDDLKAYDLNGNNSIDLDEVQKFQSEYERKANEEILKEYDLNKDSKLDKDELYKYIAEAKYGWAPVFTDNLTDDLKAYDLNKDGKVTYGELGWFKNDQDILAEYDINKDGKLNRGEAYNYSIEPHLGPVVSTQIVTNDVKVYDNNKDGFIITNEFYALIKDHEEEVDKKILMKYDINKDGKIDSSEAYKYFTNPEDKNNPLSCTNIVTDDLKAYDLNKDGKIDFLNEGSQLVSNHKLLEQLDLNKDGKLNKTESRPLSLMPWQKLSTILFTDDAKAYDKNGDGFLDADELKKFIYEEQANPKKD